VRVALYAGTFDPVTRGHLSVIERAAALFERLVVVVAVNPEKQPLFTPEERVEMLRDVVAPFPNVDCTSTGGYVVHLARGLAARYLVRGVRGATDIDGEIALAHLNHDLAPEIETVFIPARADLSEVSSSGLKDLVRNGADVSRYCPAEIVTRLELRLATLEPSGTEATHV
jgi:pantetheine-phosphate adenylyltransferase